jgi:hypothetical protein
MSEIKALPTPYNGITFRSRTEARWAVFFDVIGWQWDHEKEGFDVDGRWYLPDFYLPEFPMWFEVKPDQTDGAERKHFADLCRLSKRRGIIAYGQPAFGRRNLLLFDNNGSQVMEASLAEDRRNAGEYWLIGEETSMSVGPVQGAWHDRDPVYGIKLKAAFAAASDEKFGV